MDEKVLVFRARRREEKSTAWPAREVSFGKLETVCGDNQATGRLIGCHFRRFVSGQLSSLSIWQFGRQKAGNSAQMRRPNEL